MLLILQIWLTVVAWRKGWRSRALIPVGVSLTGALVIGLAVGAGGGSFQQVAPVLVLLDLMTVAVLIGLTRRAPRSIQAEAPSREGMAGPVAAGSSGS